MIGGLVASLRPRQWLKNLFVLAAPVYSRQILTSTGAVRSVAAFAIFCAAASGIYLVNDVADRKRDALHPVKRRRPISSGVVPVPVALGVAAVLLTASVALGLLLRHWFGLMVAVYVAIHLAYSARLRAVVLLDVFCIASGFVLRVLSGGFVVGVELSSWLILTTIFLSLFLALCKRRAETENLDAQDHRGTLRDYGTGYLEQLITITTACVIISYSMYTLDPRTREVFGTRSLVLTVPFVIYGIFRYLLLVHRGEGGGDPALVLLGDRSLLACALLWGALSLGIVFRDRLL